MGLFEKFTDTIFYKKDSELDYQIDVLKKLQNEFPNNDKIAQKLKICELGRQGEKEIEYELKNANIGMYVLRDVNLKYEDLTAQIDYFIITPAYIYFVECKNLIGNITINNNGEFIREYIYNGRKIKEGIYSPLRQAERHVEVYKKIYGSRNNGILDNLFRDKRMSWFVPLVVMANSKNILNTKYAPANVKNKVIKAEALVEYIKKDIKRTDKDLLNSKKEMNEFAFLIMNNYNITIERDYEKELRDWIKKNENIESLKDNNLNDVSNALKIRNRLIEYRKYKAKEKNIPAYYIFNNDELDKIIMLMPKSLTELKNSNILTQVKFKLYGNEIINIICNS